MMISSVLLLSAVLAGALADDDGLAGPSRQGEYTAAAANTRRDPEAHVRLALWCEAHGMTAERLKHLSLAVLYDPSNALARGLMGLVAYGGKWERPDQVSQDVQDDPDHKARIQEYLERRVQLRERADDHGKLALWCEQNGLKEQASAHWHQVLRLDPKRENAWKHLGYKRVNGHWSKPEEAAAGKAEAQQQQRGNKHWKPILEKLRIGVQSKDTSRRAAAETALSQITDRRAVPMVWATLAQGDVTLQRVSVQVLGQIDDPLASRSLVMLAVFSGSADVRTKAIETLRRRDAREFGGVLISMIHQTIKYEVKRVGGPGQPGELLIKGQGGMPNLRRLYSPPPVPSIDTQPGDRVSLDANGLPVVDRTTGSSTYVTTLPSLEASALQYERSLIPSTQAKSQLTGLLAHSGLGDQSQKMGQLLTSALETQAENAHWWNPDGSPTPLNMVRFATQIGQPTSHSIIQFDFATGIRIPVGRMAVESQQTAAAAQQQLESDVDSIKQFNASLDQINDRVVPVLQDVSGKDLGSDTVAWQTWLNNLVGFNSLQTSEVPTVTENVPLVYQPQPIPLDGFSVPIHVTRISCFGAGTKVRTLTGLDPIESLKVGDQVLSQNIKTGALGYKPILVVHHNPPSKTYQIKLGAETIVSSYFHRFWKAGSGWVMARDLKVGDPIRTLNGTVPVTAIEQGRVVPVFNLDVAGDADFFVGDVAALAHDNTLPNLRETPFDAAPVRAPVETSPRD